MDLANIIILSLVEGITEFLPISSTAHLILTSNILGIEKSDFLSTFEISIQLGAILAVIFFYAKKLINDKALLLKASIGFIPTGILGILFLKHIKVLLSDPFVPVIALFLGGIAIIGIELYFKRTAYSGQKNIDKMTYKDALLIGLIQSISMIPGVSRSASSIFGGMLLKFDRKSAVEFSFLLAIPTMIIATGYDLASSWSTYSESQLSSIFIGILFSFISALLIIKWLLKYVQNNNFISFGIYRIVLSVIYFMLFLR